MSSDHEWMDVQSGGVVSIQARLSPTEGVEAAPSDDADKTAETMCEAAYSEGFKGGERKGAEEARRAYSEGYYNGRASVEETNACMQAYCNARIDEVERACKARTMRLEAEKENAERELANLRKLETAKEMVDAIAKTRQRFVDQVVATSGENHRLHKEAEAEARELRAQLRAKMAEACELRDKVGDLEKDVHSIAQDYGARTKEVEHKERDVRQLTHELQTARGTLEARENMLAQVKEELATERLTSAELQRQRDEARERAANVNETATLARVRAEKVEKERDAIKEEAEGRSRERAVQHAKLREEIEALQAQLKGKTEQWERQKATIAIYRKDKAEQFSEHSKQRRQLESERDSLKATAEIAVMQCESLTSTIGDKDAEIAAARQKLAETKKELAEMTLYKQDEYVAAQERQTELEEEQWKAAEAEPEPDSDPEPVMCSIMGTGKSLRAERARTLFPPDIPDA